MTFVEFVLTLVLATVVALALLVALVGWIPRIEFMRSPIEALDEPNFCEGGTFASFMVAAVAL